MSEKAPHWPGADGSPGLDFSRDRSVKTMPEQLYREGAQSTQDDKTVESAAKPKPATSRPASKPAAKPSVDPGVDTAPVVITAKQDEPTEGKPKPKLAGADLERSKQSAAEWASKPMLGSNPAPQIAAAGAGAAIATRPNVEPKPSKSKAEAAAHKLGAARRTRKARLRLARIDPWSVMKTTFLFSIAFGIMMMVIAWVLWTVLEGSGALGAVNNLLTTLIGGEGGASPFKIEEILNGPRVLGFAAVLAAIDVVILTAVATLFAFLYNLAATVIGGLEVTLAED